MVTITILDTSYIVRHYLAHTVNNYQILALVNQCAELPNSPLTLTCDSYVFVDQNSGSVLVSRHAFTMLAQLCQYAEKLQQATSDIVNA